MSSRKLTICKIWDADYPWDIRVEKVANSLADAGHSVHLVCRNLSRRHPVEQTEKFTIHRLPSLPLWLRTFDHLWNFPYPLNPVWLWEIFSVVRESKADLLLVRDILLIPPALLVAKRMRIPVVLDMAENYPAMLADRLRYTPSSFFASIIRHPLPARVLESLAIRSANHIIVVTEESRDRLIRAGVPEHRLTVVSNTPPLDRWNRVNAHPAPIVRSNHAPRLIYLGNLEGSRGIDVAIQALKCLKDANRPAHLTVIGEGPHLSRLRAMAHNLGISDCVLFTGRLPFSAILGHMKSADIGLIPHYSTEAWNTTIPNKLFDYMAVGLPIIASDTKPATHILSKEDCGAIFKDRDPGNLAEVILRLRDRSTLLEKSCRAKDAFLRRYNWGFDSQQLLQTIALFAT